MDSYATKDLLSHNLNTASTTMGGQVPFIRLERLSNNRHHSLASLHAHGQLPIEMSKTERP